MAYDPADIHLPAYLLRWLDQLTALRLPVARGWQLGVTRPGIIFASALIGVWAAALYSGNNLLYLCGAMLLALSLIAIAQAILLLKQVPLVGGLLPDWCQANSPLHLRQPTPAVPVFCHGCVTLVWDELADCATWRCSGEQQWVIAQWQPIKRQCIALLRQTLTTSAPLGLWILSRHRHDPGMLVVMPPVHPLPDAISLALRQGDATTSRIGGDEFHALRHYTPGDAPTRIHWRKASNDIRDWRSKTFAASQEQVVVAHLVVDLRLPAGCDEALFEHLLGQAWGWLQQAATVGSITLGATRFTLPQQRQLAITALAAATPCAMSPTVREASVVLSLF